VIAAIFGVLLGAPTLRLRGDYLAIVTLGFGEIVPQTFLNLSQYTNGPNGISSLDQPSLFGHRVRLQRDAVLLRDARLIALGIWLARNLQNSRLGRAWMAIREDELAARTWASTRRRPSCRRSRWAPRSAGSRASSYAAKLDLVSPDQFQFNVSVLVLSMLVLGGMGNIWGVIVGSFVLSFINSFLLPQSTNLAHAIGLRPASTSRTTASCSTASSSSR
jgi:branched-chain amino acid transport system permease protein